MTTYVLQNPTTSPRSDAKNTGIVWASSAGNARTRLEAILGEVAGHCSAWTATALPGDATGDMIIESVLGPIGTQEDGNVWPQKLSRAGNPLAL